jgi:hypothetical protein
MNVEERLCRWAEAHYNLENVTAVRFALEGGEGGCDTCGYGGEPLSVEVEVRMTTGRRFFNEEYAGDLITSILEASA